MRGRAEAFGLDGYCDLVPREVFDDEARVVRPDERLGGTPTLVAKRRENIPARSRQALGHASVE